MNTSKDQTNDDGAVAESSKDRVVDKGDVMKKAVHQQRYLAIHEKVLNKKLEKRADLAKSIAQAKTELRKLEPLLVKTEAECDNMAKKCVKITAELFHLIKQLDA